jgi:hypothetical protein
MDPLPRVQSPQWFSWLFCLPLKDPIETTQEGREHHDIAPGRSTFLM